MSKAWKPCDLNCDSCPRTVCSGARALIEEREAEEKAKAADGGAAE